MNSMLESIRVIVREEMARIRGPQLATVTTVYAHEKKDDGNTYEADVRLKHDGLELKQVPLAAPFMGASVLPGPGDLVLVQYLGPDSAQPVITGRFYHDENRPPLSRNGDLVFEHRLGDEINQLRFVSDGTMELLRNVKTDDGSVPGYLAGIRLDKEGAIELRTGQDGSDGIALTLSGKGDEEIGMTLQAGSKKITVTCGELFISGKLIVSGELEVAKEALFQSTLKVGSDKKWTFIEGNIIKGGP